MTYYRNGRYSSKRPIKDSWGQYPTGDEWIEDVPANEFSVGGWWYKPLCSEASIMLNDEALAMLKEWGHKKTRLFTIRDFLPLIGIAALIFFVFYIKWSILARGL